MSFGDLVALVDLGGVLAFAAFVGWELRSLRIALSAHLVDVAADLAGVLERTRPASGS